MNGTRSLGGMAGLDVGGIDQMARERLQKRTPEQERATAIHEAGHAVIARVLGLLCGKVTIRANYQTGTSGYGVIEDPWLVIDCWRQRGKYRPSETAFRGRILAYMAGREAEEELVGHCQGGDRDVVKWIARMLMELYPGDELQAKFEKRLRIFARILVRRHRSKIEALSRALIEQRTMSDKRVRDLQRDCHHACAVSLRKKPTVAGAGWPEPYVPHAVVGFD